MGNRISVHFDVLWCFVRLSCSVSSFSKGSGFFLLRLFVYGYRFKIDEKRWNVMIIAIPKFRFLLTLNRGIKRKFEKYRINSQVSHIQANITTRLATRDWADLIIRTLEKVRRNWSSVAEVQPLNCQQTFNRGSIFTNSTQVITINRTNTRKCTHDRVKILFCFKKNRNLNDESLESKSRQRSTTQLFDTRDDHWWKKHGQDGP